MVQKRWKVTFGVLGIATFFFLWAGLNLWTDRAYYPGSESSFGGGREPGRFVTRGQDPEVFWSMVILKLTPGGLLLIILSHAHWKRWRRGAGALGNLKFLQRNEPAPTKKE